MSVVAASPYPSRVGAEPALVPRVDPVVWGGGPGPLASADVTDFERDGFVTVDGLLADHEVARLQAEVERLAVEADADDDSVIVEPGSGAVRSLFAVHERSEVLAGLFADDRLAGVARQLLDDDVYLHQTRVNRKPGFRGKEFPWHSDFETWHVEDGMPRMRALSVSVALTDNRPDNGSLMIVPGSHRTFVACVGETPDEHFRQSLRRQQYGVPDEGSLARLVDDGGLVTCTGRAGSATFFDCNAMHGSNGNITPFGRCNLFVVYNALSNALVEPFGGLPPRPDFLASRHPRPLARP